MKLKAVQVWISGVQCAAVYGSVVQRAQVDETFTRNTEKRTKESQFDYG